MGRANGVARVAAYATGPDPEGREGTGTSARDQSLMRGIWPMGNRREIRFSLCSSLRIWIPHAPPSAPHPTPLKLRWSLGPKI